MYIIPNNNKYDNIIKNITSITTRNIIKNVPISFIRSYLLDIPIDRADE